MALGMSPRNRASNKKLEKKRHPSQHLPVKTKDKNTKIQIISIPRNTSTPSQVLVGTLMELFLRLLYSRGVEFFDELVDFQSVLLGELIGRWFNTRRGDATTSATRQPAFPLRVLLLTLPLPLLPDLTTAISGQTFFETVRYLVWKSWWKTFPISAISFLVFVIEGKISRPIIKWPCHLNTIFEMI